MRNPFNKRSRSSICNTVCSEHGARSGPSMVLFYIEFLIDAGLGRGVHGLQGSGSEPSLREGPEVQVSVYHVFCWRVLRGER